MPTTVTHPGCAAMCSATAAALARAVSRSQRLERLGVPGLHVQDALRVRVARGDLILRDEQRLHALALREVEVVAAGLLVDLLDHLVGALPVARRL